MPQAPLKRKGEEGVKRQKSRSDRPATNRKPSPETSSTTCASAKENRTGNYYRQYARDLSRSPPAFSYSSCPLPEPTPQAPYPQHAPFNAVSGHFTDFPAQSLYLPPLPVTLPSMSSFDPAYVKSESVFCDDDMFGQFNLGYSPLTGMDIPSGQMYQESNVHVSSPQDNIHTMNLVLTLRSPRPPHCRILTLSNIQGQVPPRQCFQAHQCQYPIRQDWSSDNCGSITVLILRRVIGQVL